MSPEQEQAIIARLKTEYEKASRDEKLLLIELESIGKTLIDIGRSLVEHPMQLVAQGDPYFERIDRLVNELRKAHDDAKRLREQLASVGVHVE